MAYRVLAQLLLALHIASVTGEEGIPCDWCVGGVCDPTCDHVKRQLFVPGVSDVTNRTFPYWYAPAQTPFGTYNENFEVGVVVHHGTARNGDDYFCSMWNGLVKQFGTETAAISKTLLVSPQVYEPSDKPESSELFWDNTEGPPGDWKWGGNSTATLPASVSSFETLDLFLKTMADSSIYPGIRKIIVTGHSAGGQIVQRYALASKVIEDLRVPVAFFPANPSTLTYLSGVRPVFPSLDNSTCANFCSNDTLLVERYDFVKPDGDRVASCPGYNDYGYGLDGSLVPYMQSQPVAHMRRVYRTRHVNYISGEMDICNEPYMEQNMCTSCSKVDDGGLDTSCEAYFQGNCRMQRSHAFVQHVKAYYNGSAATHRLVNVPFVGHNGCAILQSPAVLEAMFD